MNIEKIKQIAEDQTQRFDKTGEMNGIISFEFEGTTIINPFEDETGRFEVNPVEYYGDAFLSSEWSTIMNEKV